MKNHTLKRISLLIATLVALSLLGCGGGSTDSGPTQKIFGDVNTNMERMAFAIDNTGINHGATIEWTAYEFQFYPYEGEICIIQAKWDDPYGSIVQYGFCELEQLFYSGVPPEDQTAFEEVFDCPNCFKVPNPPEPIPL